jgi:hypothetical protein
VTGDSIEVCGIAYCPNTTSSNVFKARIGLFSCSNASGNDPATVTDLGDIAGGTFGLTEIACFSGSYVFTDSYPKCDTLFLLGFQVSLLGGPEIVKYSYTFKLIRGCTS